MCSVKRRWEVGEEVWLDVHGEDLGKIGCRPANQRNNKMKMAFRPRYRRTGARYTVSVFESGQSRDISADIKANLDEVVV